MKKYLSKKNLIIAGIILLAVVVIGFGGYGNNFSSSLPVKNNNYDDHGHSH